MITGGAGEIGTATVRAMAEAGHRVLAVDLNPAIEERYRDLERVEALRADLGSEADCETIARTAIERFGRLDHLVTVNGLTHEEPIGSMRPDQISAVIDANLATIWKVVLACLPDLLAGGGGTVLTVGSLIGRMAIPGFGAYAMAKAGIEALTRTLAVEYADQGLRANCLVPGSVEGEMIWHGIPESEREQLKREIEEEIPLGRLARPEEIAGVAAFLVSPVASYITGTSILVDGGVMAKLPLKH